MLLFFGLAFSDMRQTGHLRVKKYAMSMGFLFTSLLRVYILEEVDIQTIVVSPNERREK